MSGRRLRRPRVRATAEFLDLCEKMKGMLIDIENEWLRLKEVGFAENKYLDRLMSLPGLGEAKRMFLHARASIKAAQRRETSLRRDKFTTTWAFSPALDVVEVSASALMGEYVGQTGPKARRLLESALGKVLFIDEAYRLALPHSYGDETVSELVDAMTRPTFARKMIVVQAGADDSMDRLLRVNPGLKKSICDRDIIYALARRAVPRESAVRGGQGRHHAEPTGSMNSAIRDILLTGLAQVGTDEAWALGRSVEILGERVIARVFKECAIKGYTGAFVGGHGTRPDQYSGGEWHGV
ncbi:Stage V sporulation protein K-like protein [Emericellopsis cladophorae]|uniref:Stage V sporulation protein K-like protein n=1 Tax=Emericellopsis cladophorae TaxID=2686198 RepID=A0A9Q0BE14_9HYPO|nr:Stage V sporulation protein K-like protein [Emericellopsis cladophorae]KAI6780754.1 Stage V sporulation protein K-like protein [Emericellopsis cladophorae]